MGIYFGTPETQIDMFEQSLAPICFLNNVMSLDAAYRKQRR
jgi:hypothetical protein